MVFGLYLTTLPIALSCVLERKYIPFLQLKGLISSSRGSFVTERARAQADSPGGSPTRRASVVTTALPGFTTLGIIALERMVRVCSWRRFAVQPALHFAIKSMPVGGGIAAVDHVPELKDETDIKWQAETCV